jgi:hypothetical protein
MRLMKQILFCMSFLFLLTSCNGQENKNNNIDASKVKEITIINKVYCSIHNLEGEKKVVTNRKEIEKIINGFSYSEPITAEVNMKMNNGFFDISFSEGAKEHIYTINYTIYNGVVLWHSGNLYKNDRLEVAIYQLFVK